MRVVRPLSGDRVTLLAMRQAATVAALAYAFRERLTPAEAALLAAPHRASSGTRKPTGDPAELSGRALDC